MKTAYVLPEQLLPEEGGKGERKGRIHPDQLHRVASQVLHRVSTSWGGNHLKLDCDLG